MLANKIKSGSRPIIEPDHKTAQVIIVGYAFMQNLRRGYYELAVDASPATRVSAGVRRTRPGDLIADPTRNQHV